MHKKMRVPGPHAPLYPRYLSEPNNVNSEFGLRETLEFTSSLQQYSKQSSKSFL